MRIDMDAVATMSNQALKGSPRRVSILGATGSVGGNTLDLIGRNPNDYDVVALTANTNARA